MCVSLREGQGVPWLPQADASFHPAVLTMALWMPEAGQCAQLPGSMQAPACGGDHRRPQGLTSVHSKARSQSQTPRKDNERS